MQLDNMSLKLSQRIRMYLEVNGDFLNNYFLSPGVGERKLSKTYRTQSLLVGVIKYCIT